MKCLWPAAAASSATAALFAGGKPLRLTPAAMIGSGGEAEVYDTGGGTAVKLFKPPEHPDYAYSPDEQAGARLRIDEHQHKLPALMRLPLPAGVVGPRELVVDGKPPKRSRVVGYTMPLIRQAEPLLRYGERAFRQNGVTWESVVNIHRNLHGLVSALHAAGFVIGDFNDLNVLVKGETPFLIDADSMQFPPYTCGLFTARFLDPLLTNGRRIALERPPNRASDWYAFKSMLVQSLLFVGPYGGVFRPQRSADRVTHDSRPLARITIFHPDVRYPKHAIPFACLPDDLLEVFEQTFVRDVRSEFPVALLDTLRWTRCTVCGTEHARSVCPGCTAANPRAVRRREVIRGRVTCEELFSTSGAIIAAALCESSPVWLAHEAGRYVREDGTVVLDGPIDSRVSVLLCRGSTFVTRDGRTVLLHGSRAGEPFRTDSLAVSGGRRLWIEGGTLLRDGRGGVEIVGSVLERRTKIWSGNRFGFGFYRAGGVTVAFVFDPLSRGINDSVTLPHITGELVDADVAFADDRCWLLTTTQERGRLMQRCVVIGRDGRTEAAAEAEAGSSEWLHSVHGNAASGRSLFVATDAGVVRVEIEGTSLVPAGTYADTEPFVHSGSLLFAAAHGLYAIDSERVVLLRLA